MMPILYSLIHTRLCFCVPQFLDDAHLRGEKGSCPVQLPLAVSGWVFKEEFGEETENTESEPMITDSTGAEVKGRFRLAFVS